MATPITSRPFRLFGSLLTHIVVSDALTIGCLDAITVVTVVKTTADG